MPGSDVLFLHAPSILDFRQKVLIHGPIGDVIPSSAIFEMYPVGFLSLCSYLEKAGFSTRIINIANKMLSSARYSPEDEIRGLQAKAFAVDLHWLPSVQGSLGLGELLKRLHPDVPLIYGGYSATYFHRELARYPFVDFVLKGDSTERPMLMLVQAIAGSGDLSRIPNLTYKDATGQVRSNEISYVPETGGDIQIDYGGLIKKVVRHGDLAGQLPFREWMKYPVTAVFPYRGCRYSCKTCGGSRYACAKVFNRRHLSVKPPGQVAAELKNSERLFNAPCMIVGDILQAGRAYADHLLDETRKVRLKNEVVLEFFVPPSDEFISRVQTSIPRYNVEMSPESHDEEIRRRFGRPFSNRDMERAVETLIKRRCGRIDLFFMIGLPGQTRQSVMETVDYCGYLLEKYGHKKTLHPFIAPLAPFVDPGSEVWEDPERFGYRLFARSLEEHRALMESALSWKDFLNYETRWMTRDEIVASTYEAALRLNGLKRKHGIITEEEADRLERRAISEVRLMGLVDEFVRDGEPTTRPLSQIKAAMDAGLAASICDPDELKWPVSLFRFNIPQILRRVFQKDP